MAARLTVPTIFTAVDRLSGIVRNMGRNVAGFANRAQVNVARINRGFNRLIPSLSRVQKQFFDLASAATISAAIIGGIVFSVKSIKDYEKAVASFRTIVSDLSNKDFEKFKSEIASVATDTKKSTTEVAASFEKIAGLNSEFAKTATGIGMVSKASIVLSKASGDDLGTSAENLVAIMNQFGLSDDQADRTINVLAAGQAAGAASISQASESYKNFGSVAKSSNITLEQSIGLIQTLGKFSIFGAEAGTALRGATLRLQKAGAGYKSGQFQINDALDQARKKYDLLSSSRKKDAFLLKLFGAENITAGKILLNNVGTYKGFTKAVTGTSEAHKAAAINTDTLTNRIDEAKASWVNYITTNTKTNKGLEKTKNVLKFITEHMDSIISYGIDFLKFFFTVKALIWGAQAALWAYNIALGVTGALTGRANIAIGQSAVALGAYKAATWLATSAQWLWNAAMTANPIGLIIAAIAALIAYVVIIVKYWDEWGAAASLLFGGIGLIVSVVQSLRRNWDSVKASFASGGILGGIMAIGRAILVALIQPIEQLLGLIGRIPGMSWAGDAATSLSGVRESLGDNMSGNDSTSKPKPLGTPSEKRAEMESQNKNTTNSLDINIHDPNKVVGKTNMRGPAPIGVKLSSTMVH